MARLAKLENDVGELKTTVVRISEILVDHSQHLTSIDRRLDGIDRKLDGLVGIQERLDRLIAVTVDERTRSFERWRNLDERVTKLEERVARPER
jgi:uncharacterized coiled-coil protein SlyX